MSTMSLFTSCSTLVSHCNEFRQDHTNCVFSQVILFSMFTSRENVRKEGEMKTHSGEKKPEAGGDKQFNNTRWIIRKTCI